MRLDGHNVKLKETEESITYNNVGNGKITKEKRTRMPALGYKTIDLIACKHSLKVDSYLLIGKCSLSQTQT